MRKLIFVLMVLPFAALAQNKLNESNYKIYSNKTHRLVTLKDVIADMDNYDVLLFGEEHNDSVTHFLEQSALELMYLKFGEDMALSLEMFDRDVQPVMDEYLQGYITERHFKKDARVWSNYRDYRPMVIYARHHKLDIICANAPARYANIAGRRGQAALETLPESSKDNFAPLPYDTAQGEYLAKLLGMSQMPTTTDTSKSKTSHSMGNFDLVSAQSLWDATMAYSITHYMKKNKGKKIMHVNGRFHSDEGFAVAGQLYNYNSRIKPLIISSFSLDNLSDIKWDRYAKYGDYVIITDPKIPKTYN